MKKEYIFLILLILFTGCSSRRYLLSDEENNRRYLIEYINKLSAQGDISKKPMIVIDGKPFRFDKELKNDRLPISQNDIGEIILLDREIGITMYGDYAKNGVLLIATKSYLDKKEPKKEDDRLYIIQDGKVITHDEMKRIDPNEIAQIEVIRDRDKISQYTDGDYNVVLIIKMK